MNNRKLTLAGLAVLVLAPYTTYARVTESVILNFNSTNGSGPVAPLLADTTGPSGNLRGLYGIAPNGASNIFKLTPPVPGKTGWKDTILGTFVNSNGSPFLPQDGALFVFDKHIVSKTPLYGTTQFGGKAPACEPGENYQGCGTVYSVAGKTLTTIWSFSGGADGGQPFYGVIADKSGALYTTTAFGGGASSCGTAVKLTPPPPGQTTWTETTIWTFTNGVDGCYPSGLIIDAGGALYGTAVQGSGNNGTVFRLTPPVGGQTTWNEQTLWTFQGSPDGSSPYANLTAGKDGKLYGTTLAGGAFGDGVVFELTPPREGAAAWKEQVLWSFTGGSDGSMPFSSVILDQAGRIYGTAYEGGLSGCSQFGVVGCGTAFELTPPPQGQTAWTETTLWEFTGGTDGALPFAAMTADKAGVLYGTAIAGGSVNLGVVFSLTGTGFVP